MKKNESQSVLFGKKILIGISGSIAAYKVPELIRLLIKEGAEVKIVMTKDAHNFVTPLTLSTVSKNDVVVDFLDDSKIKWNNHVKLGLWADIFLIAPATANTIAKMANGLCDNILLATFLSCTSPVICAPAMDRDMYLNRATLQNKNILKKRGVTIFDVEKGELASGLYGLGRMCDIYNIISNLEISLSKSMPFFGRKILITAGPTYEKIDSVRFIGNFSSGKMGCELAKQAASYGASVELILGPSSEKINHPLINVFNIETCDEMFELCHAKFSECDVVICASAVSDFKPIEFIDKKIKKKTITINTKPNKDIIKTLGQKKENQFLVGFALEIENEEKNAIVKLKKKNMDLIILNSLKDSNACFGYDTNKIKIIDTDLSIKEFPLMLKSELAKLILDEILFKKNYYSSIKKVLE